MSPAIRETLRDATPMFVLLFIAISVAAFIYFSKEYDAYTRSSWHQRCLDGGGIVAETLTERGAAGWVCVPR